MSIFGRVFFWVVTIAGGIFGPVSHMSSGVGVLCGCLRHCSVSRGTPHRLGLGFSQACYGFTRPQSYGRYYNYTMLIWYAPLTVGILVGGFTLLRVANGLYSLATVLLLVGLGNRVGLVLFAFYFEGKGNGRVRKLFMITSLFVGGVLVGLGLALLYMLLFGERVLLEEGGPLVDDGAGPSPAASDGKAEKLAVSNAKIKGLVVGLVLGTVVWWGGRVMF